MKVKRYLAAAVLLLLLLSGCGFVSGEAIATKTIGWENMLVEQSRMKSSPSEEPVGFQMGLPQQGEEIAVIALSTGGTLKLRFFPHEAPKAVYNFKLHALKGYYDGVLFHRVVPNFIVQTGDPEGTGKGGESVWGEPFIDEFQPTLLNLDGAVSMASSGKNTNGSQFFINYTGGTKPDWEMYAEGFEQFKKKPQEFTNEHGRWLQWDFVTEEVKQLYNTYGGNIFLDGSYTTNKTGNTVFAQVFEGLDAVKEISNTETDPYDRPLTEITIVSVKIESYQP